MSFLVVSRSLLYLFRWSRQAPAERYISESKTLTQVIAAQYSQRTR